MANIDKTKNVKYYYAPKTFIEQEVELDGVTKTVEEWCVERNLVPRRVYDLRRKFTPWETALSATNHLKENIKVRKSEDWANATNRKQKRKSKT